jgi:zinc protease
MNRIFFSLLLGLLAWLPSLVQAGVKIEHWRTSSGARVYFVASHEIPILDVRVDFSAGSAYDPPGKSGLAGMTVGLLDSGAKLADVELSEEQIAERLADMAAHLGASIDADRVGLSLRTLAAPPQRYAALALMRAVLSAPTFPGDALMREKTRTVAAIQESDTRPDAIALKRFRQAIYPEHPYGVMPTVASVSAIAREDVLACWRAHFGARRAVVSIMGDVSRAEAEQIAARLTDALPDAPLASDLPAVTHPQTATLKVAHPASQSHIYLGLPAIRRGDADFFPLLVGNYVLGGGGFVSRLMKEVREKRGYAYSVYSNFDPRKQEGPFEIGLQTKRAQATDAVRVVNGVLDDFIKHGPNAQELKAAKQNLVDGLALRLDSNAKILGYLATIGFYELPLTYLDDYPRQVDAVSAQQIREAFARHVPPEHRVTVMVAAD